MNFHKYKNYKLAYEDSGNGASMLLLHGFLEDHSIWDDILDEFNNYRLIRVDLPGHGNSEFTEEICEMSLMAEILEDLLKSLKIKDTVIVGHSMGGYVGLELLKLISGKLILLHSNFWEDPLEKKQDRDRVIHLLENGYGHFVREAIPGLFYSKNVEKCSSSINHLIDKASSYDYRGIAAATAGMRDRLDNSEIMESKEVYILHGEKDPIITGNQLSQKVDLLDSKPNIVVMNEVGHMSIWENRDLLIKSLNSIINR